MSGTRRVSNQYILLIVPEGIEILRYNGTAADRVNLLIVPEGIEIKKPHVVHSWDESFNRTRRN